MPSKIFQLGEDLAVKIIKRRTSRHLRLSIGSDNQVKVSIPFWASYRSGLDFARSREEWIRSSLQPVLLLQPGQSVGMTHRLHFQRNNDSNSTDSAKLHSRVGKLEVIIMHPPNLDWRSPTVQAEAEAAAVRALRKQAQRLLPHRLELLANQHNLHYSGVNIKRLKSRWGSCDQRGVISLNLFLLQLPWELIDYVLLHELTHTKHLNHSPEFWLSLQLVCPDSQLKRQALHKHKPVVKRVSTL